MMKRTRPLLPLLATAGVLLWLLAACADETYLQSQNFSRPVDMAMACYFKGGDDTPRPVPTFACNYLRHNVYGFVTNTERGDVAVFDVVGRANIDVLDWVPGYSRAQVGSMPEVVVAHPSARWVYTVNRGSSDLSRIDTRPAPEGDYEVVNQALPYRPYDLVIGPAPGSLWVPWEEDEPVYETNESAASFGARWEAYETAARDAVDGQDWVAYVSAPDDEAVLIVPLADEGFGALEGGAIQSITLTGGSPARLALSPDGATLFVNHLGTGYVSSVDITTGAEERIWLSPACSDGTDNDSDGLIDAFDPGCTGIDDETEGDLELGELCSNGRDDDGDGATDGDDAGCGDDPAVPACMDGEDNDGDGLVDMDDPGCDRPDDGGVLRRETSCGNGVDDDGDGFVDTDDDKCPSPLSDGEVLPRCSNGVDDDGDGLVDLEDPGCYGRSGDSETDPTPRELRASAVSPDGAFLYVLDATAFEVLVVQLPEGEMLDLLGGDLTTSGHPVRKREGRRGIPLGGSPQDVAFVPIDNEGVMAYVTQSSGLTAAIELQHPGLRCDEDEDDDPYRFEPRIVHRHRAVTRGSQSTMNQPVLYRGDEEIDLAFAALPSFPSMGPFHVDKLEPEDIWGPDASDEGTVQCADEDEEIEDPYSPDRPEEPRIWYGVTFPGELRQHRSETWTVRWEGPLPDSHRVGRLVDDGGLFHDAEADFCAIGVEVGDWLVLKPEERYACGGSDTSPTWDGEFFQWPILEVGPDTLRIGSPGQAFVERPEEELEDFRENVYETISESLPTPTLDCFAGPVAYEVRPREQYTVSGSLSGYLHNWRNDGGRCVLRTGEDADARFVGRAEEAQLVAELSQCPAADDEFESNFEGDYFENFVFRMRLYPGCQRELDGTISSLDGQTERGVAWRFTVASGFSPRQYVTGRTPGRLEVLGLPGFRMAYVIDPAGEALFEIDAEFDEEAINYTFY